MRNSDLTLVSLTFHPSTDATSRLMTDLAIGLQQRGLKVRVITSNRDYLNPDVVQPSEDCVEDVRIVRVRMPKLDKNKTLQKFLMYWLFGRKAVRELKRGNTRSVFSLMPPLFAPLMVTRYAYKSGIPSLFLIYDLLPDAWINLGLIKDGTAYRMLRNQLKKTLAMASSVVVIGRDMKEYIENTYGKTEKIEVIPNWAKPLKQIKSGSINENPPNDNFMIAYSGNFGEASDFRAVLSAAKILKERKEKIRFVLIGDGRKHTNVVNEARAMQLDNVEFRSYMSEREYKKFLEKSSAFIIAMNSRSKGTSVPSKFYTYLSASKPIIAIVPKNSEIALTMEEDHSGIVCDDYLGSTLAERIVELKSDKETYGALCKNAAESLKNKYSSEIVIARYVELIKELIK